MARFIPTIPDSFNGSIGEEKVFQSLRLLDDSYTIFHSFNWIGIDTRTQGEADFVIIHPAKGIMVVEVKSGEIEYKNGQWIQTNTLTRHTKIIAPFTQVSRSQFEILDRLNIKLRLGRVPLVCHAVWFPSIIIKPTDNLPPEAPRDIVFDLTTLNQCKKGIDRAFAFWEKKRGFSTNMDSRQLKEVIEVLAPHFHVVPGLKGIIDEAEQVYIKLTNQQAAVLEFLKEQKTAVIHGLAGTGKTVLAKEKARMLANDGGSVLYLCYNSFLKEYLRKNFSQPGIMFHNAHSLALEILNDRDVSIDELVAELEEYLIHVFEPLDWPYDHVVIDEGQDLNERLVNRLYELIKAKGGSFYVFYDRNQYIMKNEMLKWVENADCRLVLYRNCRNTVEIFKTACSFIATDSNESNSVVHGEMPVAKFVSDKNELIEATVSFVKKAIDAEIKPDEIVILTTETENSSWLRDITTINGIQVTNKQEEGKILFTTVRKFKGLEAKAVMIVDISLKSLLDSEKQRLLYVGASRAKHLLKIAIIEDIDTKYMGDYLRTINSSRNVPKNKKGFGRLLNLQIEN